jgi:hypothetical protein
MRRSQAKFDPRWAPVLPAEDAERDYTVRTRMYRYKGTGAWHLANLSIKQSAQIKAEFSSTARGWGSIRVSVRIGDTEWKTSLFPDKRSKTYLFAIKADVRKAEDLSDGDRITAYIRIL